MAAIRRATRMPPDDGHKGRHCSGRGIRMQATGLRTGQPAFNRGVLGALLALVAGAIVALVIVWTISRTSVVTVAAPGVSFDAATRADIEFRALEPAASAAMLKEAQEQAFNQFRADERAVLTPAQQAAQQREAVRHFHIRGRGLAPSTMSSSADAGK